MRFFTFAALALSVEAVKVDQTAQTTRGYKMSEFEVGKAMNTIGEFINDHVDEYGKFDFDDAVGVCRHIAKQNYHHKGCPGPVWHALKGAFEYCDKNADGYVTPAEFHKCYHE